MTTEATVTINGHELTKAQSMAVRVAIESFASSLHDEGLGDDEHGKDMKRLYLERIGEIRHVLYEYVDVPQTTFPA